MGERLFIRRGAILAMLPSRLVRMVSSHSAGGLVQLVMPARRASTQEPMSPTTGAAISTLLSISRGSMSIWMKRWALGLPQVLPLPCERSQLSRAPMRRTTSLSFNAVERAAPAERACVSGSRPLAMLIGT